jgi:hypothetical protein
VIIPAILHHKSTGIMSAAAVSNRILDISCKTLKDIHTLISNTNWDYMMTRTRDLTCGKFIQDLSSSQPTPGGGGATAIGAAIGMALGNMVSHLTLRKKNTLLIEMN